MLKDFLAGEKLAKQERHFSHRNQNYVRQGTFAFFLSPLLGRCSLMPVPAYRALVTCLHTDHLCQVSCVSFGLPSGDFILSHHLLQCQCLFIEIFGRKMVQPAVPGVWKRRTNSADVPAIHTAPGKPLRTYNMNHSAHLSSALGFDLLFLIFIFGPTPY